MLRKIKTGSLLRVRKSHTVHNPPGPPPKKFASLLNAGDILVFIRYICSRKTHKRFHLAECLLDGQQVYASIKHIYVIKGA